jgi:tetratricopeptide (TPR) repeat protein
MSSPSWSKTSARWVALAALVLTSACSHTPPAPTAPADSAKAATSSAGTGAQGAAASQAVEPPLRAVADFNRALILMRSGNTTEAELEFQQISVAYPQFAGPEINLGILYRKTGRLDLSEQALRAAVEHDPTNPVAWTELGVTLRMRGQFRAAADAYNKAIAADANYAPAYRNLGVLLDLYLGDAPGALAALEHYKQLTGEEKPVTGWIAELRQRVGKASGATPSPAESAQPAGQTPQGQPGQAAQPPPGQAAAPATEPPAVPQMTQPAGQPAQARASGRAGE